MRNQLLFISVICAILSHLSGYAQEEIKPGQKEGKYYVLRDTVDGKPQAFYYDSEKAYLRIKQKRADVINKFKEEKRIYESNQRTALAEDIERINKRLNSNENYTEELAQANKLLQAELTAERIQKHNELIDAQIDFYKIKSVYSLSENSVNGVEFKDDGGFEINFGREGRESEKNIGTTSSFTLAFGYNFLDGENLGIDDFSYANNNYFAMGFLWQTPLNKSQTIRFNYGITYQTHSTELNGGRAFSTNTDQTQIEDLGFQPQKAKFRQDQFVVPVQLEFGGTRKKEYSDGRVRYEQWDKFKGGIGAFAGFNTSSRLKLKYEENNRDVKETIANAFDNETFVYGVDAYLGYDNFNIFARMNLNDVFKEDSVDAQYITFGVRLQ